MANPNSTKLGFGLNVRGAAPKPRPKPKLAAFAEDDDEDDEAAAGGAGVAGELRRQQQYEQQRRKNLEAQQRALAEDPTVYDYDGAYDQMRAGQVEAEAAEAAAPRQSRYIAQLKAKAREREIEQDLIFEKRLAKEREAEDELFGDKGKFVTSAYRKKLEEQEKWKAEARKQEAREKAEDVTKRADLSDFYRNLMGGNVSFGAKPQPKPRPAAEMEGEAAKEAATKEEEERGRGGGGGGGGGRGEAATPGAAAKKGKEAVEAPRPAEGPATAVAPPERPTEAPAAPPAAPPARPPAQDPTVAKRKREEAVAAARARYLERKRARAG